MNTSSDVTLLGLCASHGNGYIREAAVSIVSLGFRTALKHLLKVLITSDAVRDFAETELDDWGIRSNLTFTVLTRDQQSKLTTSLEHNRARLSASRVAGIKFALKHG